MRAAPEMVPSLDDALLALDGFPGRVPDIGLAVRFLEQLNSVRDVPAVIPDHLQAAALEGAYQAGFRCADESGHVLVVSLPDLLAYVGHGAPSSRLSWRAKFRQLRARLFGPVPACSCGRYQHADPEQHEPDCTGPAYLGAREDAAIWKKRALEAEAKLRAQQLELVFAAPAAPASTEKNNMAKGLPPLTFSLLDASGRLAYDGTLDKGLELLFGRLPDALARRKMIDTLEKVHGKLLAGAELDADQQTAAQVAALAHQVHPDSALPSLTPAGHAARLATSTPRTCWADRDGECTHAGCPQLRDNEPAASGRHCPLDDAHEDDAR